MCMQKVLIFRKKKKTVHQLDSNPRPPECMSVALPIEPYGCVYVAWVFSTSSPSTRCNLITAFTRNDKLEVGWWWVFDVRQLKPHRMVSVKDTAWFGLLLFKNEVNNNSQTWPLIHLISLATFYSKTLLLKWGMPVKEYYEYEDEYENFSFG